MPLLRMTLLFVALSAGAASAQTVGESMATGRMSEAAAYQYVFGSGYSVDTARDVTINKIAHIKWGDD